MQISHLRAGNLVDQSMATDLTGEVTSSAGPVQLEDLQRILRSIQTPGNSTGISHAIMSYKLFVVAKHLLVYINSNTIKDMMYHYQYHTMI